MNRYPAWKNLMIVAILIVGFIYTIPNFFGESPAVQVSPARATTVIDAALLARANEGLEAANLVVEAAYLNPNGIKFRFGDTDTQLRAKDVLQRELGDGYVVALNLLTNSPRWLSSINALPMYLGLDLRGGVHFLLQVDMEAALTKAVASGHAEVVALLVGHGADVNHADATLKPPLLVAALMGSVELVTLLVEHKADREGAKKDQAESEAIRNKEKAEYDETAADSSANIAALSGAIPALEKGMGAASLMQLSGGDRLKKIAQKAQNLDNFDRDSLVSFVLGFSSLARSRFCRLLQKGV